MTHYDRAEVESRWQEHWKEQGTYHFDIDSGRPVYSIDNPPRYASGGLHAGHAVHYTHIDFVARYKRMRGFEIFFPLCFDVNGMPIEVNVEKKHGIRMKETDRHEFTKLCEEFANANIDEMTRQFRILGESMDPTIYYQTNAEYYRRLTQISFIRLNGKGLVYKGNHPVIWCPRCATALAESEMEYDDRTTKLNYIRFGVEGEPDATVEIATTRPELICTCQLAAVSPKDPAKADLVGKTLLTPIYGKPVKVVADDKVEAGFGTGVVMICTIGDKEDLAWVYKYGLPLENGIDENGLMTGVAGKYEGQAITDARAAIIGDLDEAGLLVRQEDLPQNVGGCWRCHTPIEYLQVPQWFIKTTHFKEEVKAASDDIAWFPEFMKVRLEEWVNSLSWDWVVSRQRYFATPIPVWECVKCGEAVFAAEDDCYVDPTVDHAPADSCPSCGGELKGCEEVFDTWMDSSISPLYNSFWEREPDKFARLYPMSLRPQSHDIIRTWAYYTILRGLYLTDEKPFENIMMGGFILAADGTPMHASKGNAVDPLAVLEEHGADALRYFAANCALGKDSPFRIQDVKRGLQICDKLYNINQLMAKALAGLEAAPDIDPASLRPIDRWLLAELAETVKTATAECEVFRFDQAMRATTNFMWHVLADNYLEIVKRRIYDEGDAAVRAVLYRVGLDVVKLVAPFLPHISEELYHQNYSRLEGCESIHTSPWPEPVTDGAAEGAALDAGRRAVALVEAVRRWKSGEGMPLNAELKAVELPLEWKEGLEAFADDIKAAMNIGALDYRDLSEIEEKVTAVKPVHAAIGPAFRKDAGAVVAHLAEADPAAVGDTLASGGKYTVALPDGGSAELGPDHVQLVRSFVAGGEKVEAVPVEDAVVFILR